MFVKISTRGSLLLGVAGLVMGSGALSAKATAADAESADATVDSATGSARRDEIVVTGDRAINLASAGTKSDLPLSETPQSVTEIDSKMLADLAIQNLNQAMRFVAGVTPETRGSSAEVYDQFKLRGFDVPTFLDGLKLFTSPTGYASPQVDVSRIDRIEVVKGAASALYGASSPGGFVNEQSKLPIDRDFYGAVSASYGSYDQYRMDGDVGGKLGQGVLWRLYGSANGADTQQDFGKRERQTLSGAVTLGAGSSTDFTILAAYSHDPYNGNYGAFPLVGTLIDNTGADGDLPTSFYGGEPNDYFSREQMGVTYMFNHDFGGGWKFHSAGRYQYVKSDLGIVYTSGPQADADTDPTLYGRSSYATHEQLNSWVIDNRLTGEVRTGPLVHELMFGVDRQVGHSRELYAFGGATSIDAYDPVYGTMATPASPYDVINYSLDGYVDPTLTVARQRQQGIYAQDQISLGDLRVLLSGRHDWARAEVDGQVTKDTKFTWRAAALYKTSLGLSPYASYSTSFDPQAAELEDGSLATPSLGKQYEFGAKYLIPGTDILVSGAYFHIEQTNLLVYAPVTYAATQVGKVRSKGFELEAGGSLPYGFDFRVAFSTQDVKDVEDSDPDLVGRGIAVVGKGGASVNLNWAPRSGPAEGLTIGGAMRHVDSTYAGLATDGTAYSTPSYTVFDALLRYNLAKLGTGFEGASVSLNASNLFDKKYLTSCYAAYSWCWYGNRRTVQGTLSFTW